MATPWTFRQIDWPRHTLKLEGRAAPHGAPRRKPVVTDTFELRQSKVYYSGKREPTRLIFGDQCEDWEIEGRFMDADLGPGGAIAKVLEVKEFIAEAGRCEVSWGGTLVATGLVQRIEPGRESSKEVAYKIVIGIDSDDALASANRPQAVPPSPASQARKVLDLTDTVDPRFALRPGIRIHISSNFLDILEDAADAVNAAVGVFLNVANEISDFERELNQDLTRLVTSIGMAKTAILRLVDVVSTAESDAIFLTDTVSAQVAFYAFKQQTVDNSLFALSILNDTEISAEVTQRGDAPRAVVAQRGDTWESLASRYYGGASGADALRQANGARFGEQPEPGRNLKIPSRA